MVEKVKVHLSLSLWEKVRVRGFVLFVVYFYWLYSITEVVVFHAALTQALLHREREV